MIGTDSFCSVVSASPVSVVLSLLLVGVCPESRVQSVDTGNAVMWVYTANTADAICSCSISGYVSNHLVLSVAPTAAFDPSFNNLDVCEYIHRKCPCRPEVDKIGVSLFCFSLVFQTSA